MVSRGMFWHVTARHGNAKDKERGNMSAYKWKTPKLYNIDANIVGDELNRIYKEHGKIEPAVVVEESKPKDAPMHGMFEWDDSKAAQKYREQQARVITANIVTVVDKQKDEYTRAYVHIESSYQPIEVVLKSKDKTEELLQSALRELRTFEAKYRNLIQLKPIIDAIDNFIGI